MPTSAARLEQVTHVTNCHLHFDHRGGNPLLADRSIFVQTTELSTARTTQDYTIPELVESGRYEEIDGEASCKHWTRRRSTSRTITPFGCRTPGITGT